MSDLERMAVQRVIDRAREAGVPVPDVVSHALLHANPGSPAAAAFAARFPDGEDPVHYGCPVEATICCDGAFYRGLWACTCWQPTFDRKQADPILPTSADDLAAQPRMCGDCAFRPDSPERSETYTAETLLELPGRGEPFWCHADMRRPVEWRHPALPDVVIEGNDDDYRPPMVGGIPFRTDGRPGLLCAGWMARAAKADADR